MKKLKILIAEDEKTTQALYKKGISEKAHDMRIVGDGGRALEEYESWKPDVLVLDFTMPISNGYQVLKEVRENKNDSNITIIMVTSMSEKEEIVACAKLGIQGYIIKPFKVAELEQQIVKLYNQHKKK